MKYFIILSLLFSSFSSINSAFADGNGFDFDCITPNGPGCKNITISTTVSVDQSILDNYFFGDHKGLCLLDSEWGGGCDLSKYSEIIYVNGVTRAITYQDIGTLNEFPLENVFIDKKFFLPIIESAYKESELQFSQDDFYAEITIFNEKEIRDAKMDFFNQVKMYSQEGITDTRMTDLFNSSYLKFHTDEITKLKKVDPITKKTNDCSSCVSSVSISTLDYNAYGKHIFAPKENLVESHYVDVKLAKKMPKDEDFGIQFKDNKYGSNETVVPLTSPINSIVNYWKYVLIDNKITLVYDKTIATLDTGKTKILAQNDEIIESASTVATSSSVTSASTTVTITDIQKAAESTVTSKEIKTESIFSKFINLIASWFTF